MFEPKFSSIFSDKGKRFFLLRSLWGSLRPHSMGTRGSFLWLGRGGIKRPGSEVDHSPPASLEVRNGWNYTSTHVYSLKAWCLTKKTDSSFTLMKSKDIVASSKRPDRTDSAYLKYENTLEKFNISLNVGVN